jgi:hypothetical protein
MNVILHEQIALNGSRLQGLFWATEVESFVQFLSYEICFVVIRIC